MVIAVAPSVSEYVPATHFVHVEAPSPDHVPAPHFWQVSTDVAPSSSEYVPAKHFVQLAAFAADHDPAPQFVHVVDVPPAEYVPAPHSTHFPFSNLYPPSHVKQFPVFESHVLQRESQS